MPAFILKIYAVRGNAISPRARRDVDVYRREPLAKGITLTPREVDVHRRKIHEPLDISVRED